MIQIRFFCLPALVLAALTALAVPARGEDPKLVVLGFDGADANLAARWMDEGKLPNLAKLRDEGTFRPLRSTVPSQTPVSWSTFATGLDPGRHAIFDFLKRDPKTYIPGFAAFDQKDEKFLWGNLNGPVVGAGLGAVLLVLVFGLLKLFRAGTGKAAGIALGVAVVAGAGGGVAGDRYLPKLRPVAVNAQQGDTLWEILGKAGKRARVVHLPVTFPPKPFEHGQLLTGLGTPDLSLRIGKPFYFTSELFFQSKTGGDFSVEVVELIDNRGEIPAVIKGPPNKLFPDGEKFIKIPLTLTVAEDRSSLRIQYQDTDLTLKPGEWSGWERFDFRFNPVISMAGIGRFRLLALEPEVQLYLSPIQFDPENLPPVLEITHPSDWVDVLTARHGLFKTIGWTIDTWSLSEGTISEEVFFEDLEFTVAKDEEMLYRSLQDGDWDVLVNYFEFTDRIQHMFFRFFDPLHPGYTEEGAAKWGGAILEGYQRMDRIVGETMAKMPAGARILIVSDHGFASFRRGMNYNTWLAKNGYMTLSGEDSGRRNLEDLFDKGDFFPNVDWSKTRAYALGLGQIYINLAGREGKGIVQPGAEYQALVAELQEKLTAFVDEKTGEHPVAHVFSRDEVYGQYDPALIPDLIPSNNVGYRVGWQDSLGGIAKEIVEDNDRVWSGDHCSVYPPLVNGILFSNLKLEGDLPYMGDVMPTILALYDLEPPTQLDGKSLLPER